MGKKPENDIPLIFEVISGVEGPSLYLDDTRIAGEKPWGGGRATHKWTTYVRQLNRALEGVGLEIVPRTTDAKGAK